MTSPIKSWRRSRNLTRSELASACDLTEYEIIQMENGLAGIPGEMQDYLTEQGEDVSDLASQQSAFIAGVKEKDKKTA